jgi:hypothetical protein
MPELQPGTTVLVPTPDYDRLTFARVVCSYDGSRYCVRFDDGKLARMTIPEDAAALLPFYLFGYQDALNHPKADKRDAR